MGGNVERNYGTAEESPATKAAAITPSDSADLADVSRSIYVGGAGDIKVDMVLGGTVTLVGALAGTVLPIRVSRVYSTGTTATSLVNLY